MGNERILKFNIVVTSCLIDDEFTQGQCRKGSPRGARFLWDLSLGVRGLRRHVWDCTIWCLESGVPWFMDVERRKRSCRVDLTWA